MTREQVIKGLECCLRGTYWEKMCDECPYEATEEEKWQINWDCHLDQLRKGALALLKEQEPKQVIKQMYHIRVEGGYENPVVVTGYDLLCPTCKSLLCRGVDVIDDNYHYCKVCGQAVKWDE